MDGVRGRSVLFATRLRDLVVCAVVAAGVSLGASACGSGEQNQSQEGDARGEQSAQDQGGQQDTVSQETTGQQMPASPDWEAVAQAIGKEGELTDDGVYRVEFPRSDLDVASDGVQIEPSLSLGSYASFVPMKNGQTWSWEIWCWPRGS